MESAHTDITGIAIVALLALLGGMVMQRLRQPAPVGYILAGVLLGPSVLGLIADSGPVSILAELGVLLLLYLVGMELSLRTFKLLWRIAVFAVLAQISLATLVTAALSPLLGWPLPMTLLLGFVVALSSTAVAINILDELGQRRTRVGRIAIGVLIAQDLAFVPLLLTLEVLGGNEFEWMVVVRVVGSLAGLAVIVALLSGGKRYSLPFHQYFARHADLRAVSGIALCFGGAALSGLAGLSSAYGAFLVGLLIGNSRQGKLMEHAVHPVQSVLIMVFFVSIGLLLDLTFIWNNITTVLVLLLLVTVFKTALNIGILRLAKQPWPDSFLGGLVLSQVGEFSFLLSLVGQQNGIIDPEQGRLVVTVTVLSLALSPLWVITARRLQALTQEGITSAGELMRLVYEPEAEMVAETFDEARWQTRVALRRAALWLRKRRAAANRKKAAAQRIAEASQAAPQPKPDKTDA